LMGGSNINTPACSIQGARGRRAGRRTTLSPQSAGQGRGSRPERLKEAAEAQCVRCGRQGG
jgi:hypothetical protein